MTSTQLHLLLLVFIFACFILLSIWAFTFYHSTQKLPCNNTIGTNNMAAMNLYQILK